MTEPAAAIERFDPRRLRWQVTRDAWLRGAVLVATLALLSAATLLDGPSSTWMGVALVGAIVGYFLMLTVSARASAALATASLAIDADPTRAEAVLSEAIGRRPLVRSIRLLLYHRLAVLRHKQGRHAEAAAICDGLLAIPLGRARPVRSSLLLLAAESRLRVRDLAGAWAALAELYRQPLPLVEALQRLLLRARYEVAAGCHDAALHRLDSRLQLAELMPAAQSAAMVALLSSAATAAGHPRAAELRAKAELLCTPEQLADPPAGVSVGAALDATG